MFSELEWSFVVGVLRFILTFAGGMAGVYILVRVTWEAFVREEAVRR